jgi:hypothetical protein
MDGPWIPRDTWGA